MLAFSVFFTTTACSGYKEHLFPHSYYCWHETQHIWQRWLAMMAERVLSYTGVQLSHSHYSVFGKRAFHSPPNVRKKTALLCRTFYFQRLWGNTYIIPNLRKEHEKKNTVLSDMDFILDGMFRIINNSSFASGRNWDLEKEKDLTQIHIAFIGRAQLFG